MPTKVCYYVSSSVSEWTWYVDVGEDPVNLNFICHTRKSLSTILRRVIITILRLICSGIRSIRRVRGNRIIRSVRSVRVICVIRIIDFRIGLFFRSRWDVGFLNTILNRLDVSGTHLFD